MIITPNDVPVRPRGDRAAATLLHKHTRPDDKGNRAFHPFRRKPLTATPLRSRERDVAREMLSRITGRKRGNGDVGESVCEMRADVASGGSVLPLLPGAGVRLALLPAALQRVQ